MTSRKYHDHYIPTGNTMSHSLLKMDLCSVEYPSSSLHRKGRRSLVLCTNHIKASPKDSCSPVVVFSGLISTRPLRKQAVRQCKTCMRFQAQNVATPLTPTSTPSCPWQICASDIFTLDGMDYLILADFYSKVILVQNLPTGQSNSAKVIHILEEWIFDHGTPEVLCTDNAPQCTSAAIADCSIEWGFTHETSSPHYPQSNGFVKSCVKIVKHTLQHAKYDGANPRIALQHLKDTPADVKLPSPSQMLHNLKIHTTIPSRICNIDPPALQVHEYLEDQAEHANSYADKGCKHLAPFYAVESIAIFDTLRKIWIPATVVCVLPKNSYQLHTENGTIYQCTRCHLWEYSVRCNDAEPKAPSEQAHTSFPRPVP